MKNMDSMNNLRNPTTLFNISPKLKVNWYEGESNENRKKMF
jgi:hypothetical protein